MEPFKREMLARQINAKAREHINFKTTPEEWTIVTEEAIKRGMTKSMFIRTCIAAYLETEE